jgi:hypothetical protein
LKAICLMFLVIGGCSASPEATPPELTRIAKAFSDAAVAKASENASQGGHRAITLIWSLPQVIAWSNILEMEAQGEVHGIAMADAGRDIRQGQEVWTVGVFESHETHIVRWATFEVNLTSVRIQVWDWQEDAFVSVSDWKPSSR